jgi:hypothetical protein
MIPVYLLRAAVKKVQVASKKGVSLPTSLKDAAISNVIVEDVVNKVTQEALLDTQTAFHHPLYSRCSFQFAHV